MLAALLMVLQVASTPMPADATVFDPITGYRIGAYRGVVPAPPEGVPRVDVGQAARLKARGALFVDVTPAEGGGRHPATGEWRLASVHRTIPGAHWFPEAGRGRPDAAIAAWFDHGLARSVGRRGMSRTIVVFCLADCWMSWNAALRLRRAGYRDVHWFADGVDGWIEAGRGTVLARPFAE